MAKKVQSRVALSAMVRVTQACTIDGIGPVAIGETYSVEQCGGMRAAEILVRDGIVEFITAEAGE